MSFLYNKSVYLPIVEKLLKQAQQPNAPGTPDLTKDQSQVSTNSVALKLINNLSREISGQQAPLNLTSDSDITLTSSDLVSKSTLFYFLSKNKVMLDGKRIVYTAAEATPQITSTLSEDTGDMGADAKGKRNNVNYYFDPKLLIPYLRNLQEKAEALNKVGDTQGRLLQTMTGKIIEEVNQAGTPTGLVAKPVTINQIKTDSVPENTVLDGFNSSTFDKKNPQMDGNADSRIRWKFLLVDNLNTPYNFYKWLIEAPPAQIIVDYKDDNGNDNRKTIVVSKETIGDRSADLGVVLYVLNLRANRVGITEDAAKNNEIYKQKLQTLASSLNINNSVIGNTGNQENNVQNEFSKQNNQNQIGQNNTLKQEDFEKLKASYPLSIENISLDRIERFFTITGNDKISAIYNNCIPYLRRAKSLSNTDIYTLSTDADTVMTWLAKPSSKGGNPYKDFLNQLRYIIKYTGDALNYIYVTYGNQMQRDTELPDLAGQLSLVKRNTNEIETLMSDVPTNNPYSYSR